jgi:hypothetical protein
VAFAIGAGLLGTEVEAAFKNRHQLTPNPRTKDGNKVWLFL